MTQKDSTVDRRTVLQGFGTMAIVGTIAGCTTDSDGDGGDGSEGGDGSDGSDGGGGNSEVEDYLSNTSNYDGIVDETGSSEVTVDVGASGNTGNFAYEPAAIRVDTGTTVVFEWVNGYHNVVDEDGNFESELTDENGFTFEHQFDSAGTYLYFCQPHKGQGMKGAVVVE